MGMYDSIMLTTKCPYCGEESEIEFQTKDAYCQLRVFRVGDFIDEKQLKYLTTIADCRSKECKERQNKKSGYVSGFGSMFYANVFLEDGVITGEFEITELIDKDN